MVAAYCANGIKSLQYIRDVGVAEHASFEILGYPGVINYLRDRLNGIPAPLGCSTTNTTTTVFTATALGANLVSVLTQLLTILNKYIGLDDGLLKASIQASVTAHR